MAHRTIELSFWSDPVVRSLNSSSKLLYIYLITSEDNHMTGIFRYNKGAARVQTGLSIRAIDESLKILIDKKRVVYDRDNEILFIVKMLGYQVPNLENLSGTTAKMIQNWLSKFQNTEPYSRFIDEYPNIINTKTDAPCDAPKPPPSDASIQVPVISKQNTDKKKENSPIGEKKKIVFEPSIELLQVIELYNEFFKAKLKTNPPNKIFAKQIDDRLKEGYGLEDFMTVFRKKQAEWGGDPEKVGWLNLETLTRPSNFEKYLNQPEPQQAVIPKNESARERAIRIDLESRARDIAELEAEEKANAEKQNDRGVIDISEENHSIGQNKPKGLIPGAGKDEDGDDRYFYRGSDGVSRPIPC